MTRLWRILRVLLVGSASLIVLLLVLTAAERVLWRGKVLPGVRLVGASVGGKGAGSLGDSVAEAAARFETEPIDVRVDTERLVLDPRRIDLSVDRDDTTEAVQDAGRSGNPLGQVAGTLERLFSHDAVMWDVSFDEEAFDEVLDEWADEVAVEPQDGTLEFEGARVRPVQPKAGRALDRPAADRALVQALRMGAVDQVRLPAVVDRPDITRAEVVSAAAEARALLAAPVTVNLDTVRAVLQPADLGDTLRAEEKAGRLRLRVDHDALKEALGPDAAALEGPPEDADFSVEGTKVVVVPHRVGRAIDLGDLEKKILAGTAIVAGTFEEEAPETTTEELEALNIEELVSSFTTNYPAGQQRVKNIQKAASITNDRVVPPGATFSLNDTLGKRTAAEGWVIAPVIYGGEFSEDVGGGVSQFATTMFNAAFFGGYPLVDYKAHTFYISRYPMGREATVSYPTPDLKWRNDTDNAVLIRSSAGGSSVTVSFYSTKVRNVAAEGPQVVERIAPPEEVVVDGAVPRGTQQVRERGSEGSVVRVTRVIRSLEGDELGRKTYTTRYRPQKKVVAYHPCDHPDPAKRPPPEAPECQVAPPPPADTTTTTTTVPGAGPP